jgi:hypothetical protein
MTKYISRVLQQLTQEGELVAEFNRIVHCTQKTGINCGNISRATGDGTIVAGYLWKWRDLTEAEMLEINKVCYEERANKHRQVANKNHKIKTKFAHTGYSVYSVNGKIRITEVDLESRTPMQTIE